MNKPLATEATFPDVPETDAGLAPDEEAALREATLEDRLREAFRVAREVRFGEQNSGIIYAVSQDLPEAADALEAKDAEIERLHKRDTKLREQLRGMLHQMGAEAEGRLYGYPHWLESILNAE